MVMTKNHSQGLPFAAVLVAFGWLQMKEKKRIERERSIYIKGNGIITRFHPIKRVASLSKQWAASHSTHTRVWQLPRHEDES